MCERDDRVREPRWWLSKGIGWGLGNEKASLQEVSEGNTGEESG